MYPIHLYEDNDRLGFGYDEFEKNFYEICEQQTLKGCAKAFAFVFYDMCNSTISAALNEGEGFNRLNEASGKKITIFYLHADSTAKRSEDFNSRFMKAVGVNRQISPPCVVFFRVSGVNIEDVSIHRLDGRTRQTHMVVEQLRRLIVENIEEREREGDLSALTIIGKVVPLLKFFKSLAIG